MTDHLVALTTTPTEAEAHRLAQELVDARLAACVQVTQQITSVYRWQGERYTEPEWQVWIKTAADRQQDLIDWLPSHHSGEVPELIFLPIVGGSPAYLQWITDETH